MLAGKAGSIHTAARLQSINSPSIHYRKLNKPQIDCCTYPVLLLHWSATRVRGRSAASTVRSLPDGQGCSLKLLRRLELWLGAISSHESHRVTAARATAGTFGE